MASAGAAGRCGRLLVQLQLQLQQGARCFSSRGGAGAAAGAAPEFEASRGVYRRQVAALRAEFREEHAARVDREAQAAADKGRQDKEALEERKRARREKAAANVALNEERKVAATLRKAARREQNAHADDTRKQLDEWYWRARLDSSEARLKSLGWCDAEEDVEQWMANKLDRVQTLVSPRSLAEDADPSMWQDEILKRP